MGEIQLGPSKEELMAHDIYVSNDVRTDTVIMKLLITEQHNLVNLVSKN